MKILIIEDEIVARNRLIKMVQEYDETVTVMDALYSVVDSINFLSDNDPDLILMDIQLSDGLCFEIFEHISVEIPVIFITAYDQYMLDAFKVNSVDYLLKPIHINDLSASLDKYKKLHTDSRIVQKVINAIKNEQNRFKHRFLVRSGRAFVSIDVGEIAYFVYRNKLTYLISRENKKYVVDHALEHLECILDPDKFNRISRNMIVSCKSVKRIEPYFNNRLLLMLEPETMEETIVSRSYLKSFKKWMDL